MLQPELGALGLGADARCHDGRVLDCGWQVLVWLSKGFCPLPCSLTMLFAWPLPRVPEDMHLLPLHVCDLAMMTLMCQTVMAEDLESSMPGTPSEAFGEHLLCCPRGSWGAGLCK